MPVEGEFVRFDMRDAIGTIRLDRPPMNALSRRCAQEIRSAARQAADRTGVRAVIVYGGEKVFAAGADVKEMATMPPAEVAAQVAALSAAFRAVADIPKPTVAAIGGFALGGGTPAASSMRRRHCGSAWSTRWSPAMTCARRGSARSSTMAPARRPSPANSPCLRSYHVCTVLIAVSSMTGARHRNVGGTPPCWV